MSTETTTKREFLPEVTATRPGKKAVVEVQIDGEWRRLADIGAYGMEPDEVERVARAMAAGPRLLAAAEIVYADLCARIDAAPATAKPVFNGIADLHDAIMKARGEF